MDETTLDFFELSGDEGAFETLLFEEVILSSDSYTLFFVLFGLKLNVNFIWSISQLKNQIIKMQ